MLVVETETLEDAQSEAIKLLLEQPRSASSDPELITEQAMLFRILNPTKCAVPWRTSLTGVESALTHLPDFKAVNEAVVQHYSERIKLESVDDIVDLLGRSPYTKRAVLTLWELGDSKRQSGSACVNYYWFRRVHRRLVCRAHMRACDVYTKLKANIAISCDLQISVAKRLGLRTGVFELITDCAHLYKRDRRGAKGLLGDA